jgi:hypothetical protein
MSGSALPVCDEGVLGGAAGVLSILTWGAKGSKDVKLPITVGPLGGGEKGPRGKI